VADEPLIAVFIDYENLAIGARQSKKSGFRIELVLRRLLEKGRVVFKRAYCDWSQYRSAVRDFHSHGIELVDIPQSRMSGKNSADIHMVVDAIDLAYQKQHIDIFALLSGDSDFSPLVAKLKENDKRVIGCGVKQSTSDLLIASCDEFIYYDDLVRGSEKRQQRRRSGGKKKARKSTKTEEDPKQAGLEKVLETVEDLLAERGEEEKLWGSMVKQTLKRREPGFSESYHGFSNFSELLAEAQKQNLLELEYDEKSGGYIIKKRR